MHAGQEEKDAEGDRVRVVRTGEAPIAEGKYHALETKGGKKHGHATSVRRKKGGKKERDQWCGAICGRAI